ncbi:hypothetical protein ACFE04_010339 [Oxalis oulophora]
MVNKVLVSAVSVILVVGVVIGVVAVTSKSGANEENLTPHMKMVNAMCHPTDYKEACVKSMGKVNSTNDPKEFIKAAILSTMDGVQKSLNLSQSLVVQANNDEKTKMALDDCKDLMDYAVQQLQAIISTVGDNQMNTLSDHVYDIQNWLSSVISFQESCLDQFDEGSPVKTQMNDGMVDAREFTRNALAIVSQMSSILESFGLKINISTGRKLLGQDGYPTWIVGADRKLLAANQVGMARPNAVVAKDGSGQFKTITEALATVPKKNAERFVIYVKAGVYDERVIVTKDMTNVFMYGDGPRKTIVTGNLHFTPQRTTQDTATFNVLGAGFIGKSMGFRNTAGAINHQAVALRVNADRVVFYNCRIDAYQDTLYTQALRQYYRNCVISGTVDFIFGDATVVIQNSLIVVRRPMDNQRNIVTAHGRSYRFQTTGLVIHNCRIVPEAKLFPDRFKIQTYLGRPWKLHSRTVIMESTIADFIQADGWMPWKGDFALNTLEYREYANKGPGANTMKRVNWKGYKVITNRAEALQYTVESFLMGGEWIPASGATFLPGLLQ